MEWHQQQIQLLQVLMTSANATINGNLVTDDITTETLTTSGNLTVSGNLMVSWTTTTVNSNTVNIGRCNIIILNSDETGTPYQNAGFEIERGTEDNEAFLWNETNDRWTTNGKDLTASTFIGNLTGNVTGQVSTLSNHDTDDLSKEAQTFTSQMLEQAAITGDSNTGVTVSNGVVSIGQSVGTSDSVTFAGISGPLTGNATTATTLETARKIQISGDMTGSETFNGSANINISGTLSNSGVTAGSYGSTTAIPNFTVDSKGRITSASTNTISTTLGISSDSGTESIALGSETLTFTGGTGINTSITSDSDTVSFNIDNTVVTLNGNQTLTSKTLTTPTINGAIT